MQGEEKEKKDECVEDAGVEDVGWPKSGKRSWLLYGGLSVRQVFVVLLVGYVLFRSVEVDAQALTDDQVKQLKEFLQQHNPDFTNFTYDQLKQWFEAQVPENLRWEEYPRLYPFCVTASQVNDSRRTRKDDHIYKFLEIFTDIERINEKFYNFNVSKHSMHGNRNWVKMINMSRINTPEMDMVNLRQWLHIKVTMAEPMQALYMQTIVGPMGLPNGEFFLDFPCKDNFDATKDISKVGQLSYCSYRPRTTIQHPSVYVGWSPTKRTEFYAHFFWTDITCMETPYIQFLLIAVKDFNFNDSVVGKPSLGKNYQPLLSPIYINTAFDSKSGAPFPYYPEWNESMYCNISSKEFDPLYKRLYGNKGYPSKKVGADGKYDGIHWETLTAEQAARIQANEVYDACITGKSKNIKTTRDDARLECPPGPFRCDTSYGNISKDQVTAQRELLVTHEKNISGCFPCGAPECLDLDFPEHKCDYLPDELYKDLNESSQLNEVETLIRAKTHGVQATFAFLVLVPLSNFMARFYKEMCGKCLCGNGPWIFVHVASHVFSIIFMWISLGPVLPRLAEINQQRKECNALHRGDKDAILNCVKSKSAENPHVVAGLLAFLIQHFLVMFGFWRAASTKVRNVQVALHSHFGYGCWILGAVAAIIAGLQVNEDNEGKCQDVLILAVLFFITPILFSAAGVALDCMTDRKVGIIPPRRQWPILETIKLEGRGPFNMPKWIVFGVYVGIMIFYWLFTLSSSLKIVSGSSNLLSENVASVNSFFGSSSSDCGNTKRIEDAEKSAQVKAEVKKHDEE